MSRWNVLINLKKAGCLQLQRCHDTAVKTGVREHELKNRQWHNAESITVENWSWVESMAISIYLDSYSHLDSSFYCIKLNVDLRMKCVNRYKQQISNPSKLNAHLGLEYLLNRWLEWF